MENFKQLFLETMQQEVNAAKDYQVALKTAIARHQRARKINNPNELILPEAIVSFYDTCSSLIFLWEIVENIENTKQFRENEYLTNKYYNNDYSWDFVKGEMLTGFINITGANDIFNPKFCKKQFYHFILNKNPHLGNKDDFFAFDVTSKGTACFKKEGNEVIDNIWLIDIDANAVYDMKIGIADYLNLAYEAKCLVSWQKMYLFKSKAEEYQIMKQILPSIFPNVSLDLKGFGL